MWWCAFAIPKVCHINCFTFVKHRVEAYLAVKVYIRIVQLYNLITGLDTGLLSRITLNNTCKLRTVIAYRADDNESKINAMIKLKTALQKQRLCAPTLICC